MSDTERSDEAGSVLRPFEETEQDPLPPVEPSKVVPSDRAPEVPDTITPDDVMNAPGDPPVEGEVPDIEPVATDDEAGEAAEADPDDGSEIEDIWAAVESEEEVIDEPEIDEPEFGDETSDVDGIDATGLVEEVPLTDGDGPAETVVLPRKPFLIGLGGVALLLVVLVALWQTADGGDGSGGFAGEVDPTGEETNVSTPANPDGPGDATDPEAAQRAADLQAEVDGLNAQVDVLESELANLPPPSLSGADIHRIPVASGSKFVSARNSSVAVVSPFGGYANINPDTDTVTAAGTVAGGATRVIRTPTSVWVTSYTENKIVRIDPQANNVAASFDFPGPDGLAKFGDFLLVASFDGGFLGLVDPTSGEITDRIDLGGSPTDVLVSPSVGVWVALFDTGELLKIDPDEGEVTERVLVGAGPVGLAPSASGVWVANHGEGTVALVDSETGTVTFTTEVGEGPTGLIAESGTLWVTVTDAGDLVQVDVATGDVIGRTPLGGPVGGGPVGIDKAAGSLWVAMDGEDSVVRIALPE